MKDVEKISGSRLKYAEPSSRSVPLKLPYTIFTDSARMMEITQCGPENKYVMRLQKGSNHFLVIRRRLLRDLRCLLQIDSFILRVNNGRSAKQ